MSDFQPVSTLADVNSLDEDEIVSGYRDWRPDGIEPGLNRGRSYWRGWMNAARDHGASPPTWESSKLCREFLDDQRRIRKLVQI